VSSLKFLDYCIQLQLSLVVIMITGLIPLLFDFNTKKSDNGLKKFLVIYMNKYLRSTGILMEPIYSTWLLRAG
jgi:hypothetical protein